MTRVKKWRCLDALGVPKGVPFVFEFGGQPVADEAFSTPASLALNWLDQDATARFLLNKRLSVLWANKIAVAWLSQERPLTLRSGELWLGNSQAELRSLINSAREHSARLTVPSVEKSEEAAALQAVPLWRSGERIFGVTVRLCAGWHLEEVSRAFSLTRSETSLLRFLLDGLTAKEAAAALRISIDTARTHVRRVYLKLDVKSREGLFARLRPFLTPM